MSEKKEEKKPRKEFKSGHYCCVKDCHHRTGRALANGSFCSFFHVLRANETQTELWRQAIRRENADKSLWKPTASSMICGCHFVKGKDINVRFAITVPYDVNIHYVVWITP